MTSYHPLSTECCERLDQWVRAYYPAAFDDPRQEFLRGLVFIVEEEVRRVADTERCWLLQRMMKPCKQ